MISRVPRVAPRYARVTTLLLVLSGLGCCSTQEGLATYMQPELLYLRHYPYPSLYVEVDSLEGVTVPTAWLDELEATLAKHCAKPGGITMVRDEPIPLSEVQGLSAGMIELLCTDGPPMHNEEQPAYLHVFFHDTKNGPHAEIDHPYMSGHCPSTVFFNVDYMRRLPNHETMVLTHEAGHLLGLCKNRRHGDGMHCRNDRCLMGPGPDPVTASLRRLTGVRFRRFLCADCLQDLESEADGRGSPCSFAGPFLVRREEGYAIASLPYYTAVVLAPERVSFDWRLVLERGKGRVREVVAQTDSNAPPQAESHEPGSPSAKSRVESRFQMVFSLLGPADLSPATGNKNRILGILNRVAKDPCPYVRQFARQAMESLRTGTIEIDEGARHDPTAQ